MKAKQCKNCQYYPDDCGYWDMKHREKNATYLTESAKHNCHDFKENNKEMSLIVWDTKKGQYVERQEINEPFLNAGLEEGDEIYPDGTIKRNGKVIVKGEEKCV